MLRQATPADIDAMIELGEQKRIQYEDYQPVFWRKAPDSAEKAGAFLQTQLTRENVLALVHEAAPGAVNGFLVAVVVPSPPVYNPGGATLAIDDFWVDGGRDWMVVGAALLTEAIRWGKEHGAAQVNVVTGQLDEPKREVLRTLGMSIASEWWVKPIG